MTDFGVQVLNASTDIQIDSKYRNYSLLKEGVVYTKPLAAGYPYLVATFPNQTVPPIFTIFPPRIGFVSLQGVTATHAVLQPHNVGSPDFAMRYQVWQRGIVRAATWGINVNNASGNTVFSNEDHHFTISGVATRNATLSSKVSNDSPMSGGVGVTIGRPTDFTMYAPTAVMERRNIPPAGNEGWLVERAVGWGKPYGSNASTFWTLGRSLTHYPVDGDTAFVATLTTSTGSLTMIGIRNTNTARFQKWDNIYKAKSGAANYPVISFSRVGSLLVAGTVDGQALQVPNRGKAMSNWNNAPISDLSGTFVGLVEINIAASSLMSASRVMAWSSHSFPYHITTFRSVNAGDTWSTVATNDNAIQYMHWIGAATVIGAGASIKGVYRSVDYGQNFNFLASLPNNVTPFNYVNIPGTSALLAYDAYRIWKSYDNAESWTSSLLNVLYPNSVTDSPATIKSIKWIGGQTLLMGFSAFANFIRRAKIVKSIDGGDTWTEIINFSATWNYHPHTNEGLQSISSITCGAASDTVVTTVEGSRVQIWSSNTQGDTWDFMEELSDGWKKSVLNRTINGKVDIVATNTIIISTTTPNIPIDSRNYLWRNYDGIEELWN